MPFKQFYDPSSPLQVIRPPKGSHLIRVSSITNRKTLEMYYRTQLAEWSRLEFDNQLVEFDAVNKNFCWEGKMLFIAFRISYLHGDCFAYIDQPSQPSLIKAFENYCSTIGSVCKPLGNEVIAASKIEIWNRLKMLSIISRWKDQITSENLKKFVAALDRFSTYSLSEIEKIDAFAGGRGQAYAFEMVRIGRFRIDTLNSEMITNGVLIKLISKGV
jgi:hypothetical protein